MAPLPRIAEHLLHAIPGAGVVQYTPSELDTRSVQWTKLMRSSNEPPKGTAWYKAGSLGTGCIAGSVVAISALASLSHALMALCLLMSSLLRCFASRPLTFIASSVSNTAPAMAAEELAGNLFFQAGGRCLLFCSTLR